MAEPKWTPGPWRYGKDDRFGGWSICGGDMQSLSSPLARVSGILGDEDPAAEHDARLIAASPRLAEYVARKAAEGDRDAAELIASI